jgi:nucleoid-associated protein YgaU
MGWLTKASETVFGPASESDQQRTPDSDTEQALVGNQEVAQRAGVEARQTAGTVVAKAGDSVSGLALKGTGDAHRYPELTTFNRRNAEDASLDGWSRPCGSAGRGGS